MNILVINGSPRGKASNTYRLTQAFLEGIKQAMLGQAGTGGQKADAHGKAGTISAPWGKMGYAWGGEQYPRGRTYGKQDGYPVMSGLFFLLE